MAPLRALAARDGLPVSLPQDILDLVEKHGREMQARRTIDDWRRDAAGIEDRRRALIAEAARRELALVELPDWRAWRDGAGTVRARGRGLAGDPAMAPHLDRSSPSRDSLELTAEFFRQAELQAPEPARKRQAEERLRRDRSQGGGMKI